jgi:hypothetical protein
MAGHSRAKDGVASLAYADHPGLVCLEFQQTMAGTSPGMTVLSELPRSSTILSSQSGILLDPARRLDEGADHLAILVTRRTLHAGGNIDAAGSRD